MLQVSGTISHNVFIHNHNQGIYVGGGSGVLIENNLIQSSGLDGILLTSNASGEIRFNTLVQNGIGLGGFGTVNALVRNNILAQGYRGITIYGDSVTLSLSCNDIWNSVAGDCPGLPSGCIGVDGNISLDPLFCNGYYLHQESPCLGANTPSLCNGEHMGCYAVACEVATQKQSWGTVKAIFR